MVQQINIKNTKLTSSSRHLNINIFCVIYIGYGNKTAAITPTTQHMKEYVSYERRFTLKKKNNQTSELFSPLNYRQYKKAARKTNDDHAKYKDLDFLL